MPGLSGPPSFILQVATGLQGASLLARGHAGGVDLTSLSPAGPARSFFAALLCAPAYAILRLSDWGDGAPDLFRPLVSELVAYVLGWTAFALLSLRLSRALGRGALWPRFIAAWNWVSVVQYAVLLAVGLLPAGAAGAAMGLMAAGYTLWVSWFVATSTLRIGRGYAVCFVLLDVSLSLMITEVARNLATS